MVMLPSAFFLTLFAHCLQNKLSETHSENHSYVGWKSSLGTLHQAQPTLPHGTKRTSNHSLSMSSRDRSMTFLPKMLSSSRKHLQSSWTYKLMSILTQTSRVGFLQKFMGFERTALNSLMR